MKNTEYFRDKKVVIIGLARSGVACAKLLHGLGAKVSVTDNKDNPAIREEAGKLKPLGIKIELSGHTKDFIKGNDLVVISPGVTISAAPVLWAKELNIPVISEIEAAWSVCPGKVIAVTGSNGKTTVTTLIGKILQIKQNKVFTCGNIGVPFSGEVAKMKEGDFICLEVSSFQLEAVKDFKPQVAAILNFTANHLDRHKDMEEYFTAKKRIFMNQDKDDYLVLNGDDPFLSKIGQEAKAKKVYFFQEDGLNPNQSAALAVGAIFGVDKSACLKVFSEFKGVEHRQEFIRQLNGVRFINDSKATTVESALWALASTDSPILLIAGGRDKGLDYRLMAEAGRKKVKKAILIGEAREKIGGAFKGLIPVEEARTLEEAVGLALGAAAPGDTVLLSPMCSSFDMFDDYEDRGRRFKRIVLSLEGRKDL